MKDLEKKARTYALKNAVAYDGVAREGSVISALFNEGLKPNEVKKYYKKIAEVILSVNSLSPEEQKKEFSKLEARVSHRETREGLPELPNAKKGKVIMRFAPSASGPLHIGHIISNMASSMYVKKYGGKFYIRIEDTNPKKVDSNAYAKIKEDCNWIFGNVHEYIIQSDRIPVYYKYAEELIKKKAAYVCTCSQEKFKKYVDSQKECPCRKIDVKDNILRWNRMLGINKPVFNEGEAVLRFKSNMKDKNPAMRDFPLARVNLAKHPRQGCKYRVWPLMNLSVTADDIEYKMTHVIRGKDHKDNAERQRKIYRVLGIEKKFPWTYFVGRVKFSDLPLSKRKIMAALDEGEFENWDDPRLPTISSLRKRGYKPKAFVKLTEQRGLSEVDRVMSSQDFFKLLDTFNRG